MALEKLHSIPGAAEFFNVSESTVRAWLSQGRLQRTKLGARTMIRESDLEAFMKKCNETEHSAQ